MSMTDYKQLFQSESVGSYGHFGIRILVAGDLPPDLSIEPITWAAHKAADAIQAEIMAVVVAADAQAQAVAMRERADIIGLFDAPIFVEDIPNGYCNRWCCRHLPWFIVTTGVGRFKVGWRKRVIHLEWTETVGTKDARELFPAEDVTMMGKMIHAWSTEKAKQYVQVIQGK